MVLNPPSRLDDSLFCKHLTSLCGVLKKVVIFGVPMNLLLERQCICCLVQIFDGQLFLVVIGFWFTSINYPKLFQCGIGPFQLWQHWFKVVVVPKKDALTVWLTVVLAKTRQYLVLQYRQLHISVSWFNWLRSQSGCASLLWTGEACQIYECFPLFHRLQTHQPLHVFSANRQVLIDKLISWTAYAVARRRLADPIYVEAPRPSSGVETSNLSSDSHSTNTSRGLNNKISRTQYVTSSSNYLCLVQLNHSWRCCGRLRTVTPAEDAN